MNFHNETAGYFVNSSLEAEDALQDAYFMALDRGYDEGDLAALREIILTETTYSPDALERR